MAPIKLDAPSSSLLSIFSFEKNSKEKNKKQLFDDLPFMYLFFFVSHLLIWTRDTSLSSFYPPTPSSIQCLHSISFSGWNPPRGNRRLLGITEIFCKLSLNSVSRWFILLRNSITWKQKDFCYCLNRWIFYQWKYIEQVWS